MNIIKRNPIVYGKTFSNLMDEVFNRSISDLVGGDYSITSPSVNITENDQTFLLEMAAPGLEKSDFNIAIENDQLVISAQKEDKKESSEEGKWTKKEFNFSSFKRSFHLSDAVDSDHIQAEYQNGILKLVLPKKENLKLTKSIEVK